MVWAKRWSEGRVTRHKHRSKHTPFSTSCTHLQSHHHLPLGRQRFRQLHNLAGVVSCQLFRTHQLVGDGLIAATPPRSLHHHGVVHLHPQFTKRLPDAVVHRSQHHVAALLSGLQLRNLVSQRRHGAGQRGSFCFRPVQQLLQRRYLPAHAAHAVRDLQDVTAGGSRGRGREAL